MPVHVDIDKAQIGDDVASVFLKSFASDFVEPKNALRHKKDMFYLG